MNLDGDCGCEADYGIFGDRSLCEHCKKIEREDAMRPVEALLIKKPERQRRRRLTAADVMLAQIGRTSILDK